MKYGGFKMKKLFWFMVGFCLIFSVGIAQAASNVTLEWTDGADPDGDLAGVRIYAAATPGGQDFSPGAELADVAAGVETATILLSTGTWYIVAVSYDLTGLVSGPSNEISDIIDPSAPGAPTILTITLKVTVVIE